MKQFLQLIRPFREMRKIAALSFVLFALVAIPMGMMGQTRTEVTYDFSEIQGFDQWSSSYAQHVVEYDDATVTFTSANKNTQTITDIPVTKGQPVSLVLNETTNNITSVSFVCRQWGSKSQTITLHYSTDGGTNYTSTNITSTNFTISSTSLPEGTNAVKITFNSTSNQIGIESVTFNIEASSSTAVATAITIDESNLTNTDVYVGTEAGSLSATVTAGETIISDATVNWTSSDEDVATIDADGVVTLVAEGTTTITAAYAGEEGQYLSSSATYTLEVTNSTPFTGGDITFVAGTDLGSTTSNADGDEMTKSVVTVSSTSAAFATDQYRIYSGSTSTISTTYGVITQIAFTKTGNYSLANLSTQTGDYNEESGIWTGNATSVAFSASAQVRLSQIVVTIAAPAAVATPVFTPEEGIYFETQNVTISCETPNSDIYYTTDGTEPTNASTQYTGAIAVAETTTIKAVAYVGTDHSYVATATYTIEQPLSTIEEIFNVATTTPTTHRINFNNWVITGANNSNHSFLSDGTNGCMIYGSEQGFTAGDILSGIVECDIQIYNGSLELTNLNSSATGLTVTEGGTVTVADIAMADLAAINTGALVSYQNLTCSVTSSGNYTNYYLTDGTTQIQVYTTLYNDLASSLENGKTYNITGVFVQNDNTKRINPRSADDIEEVQVQHEEYTLTVSDLNHVNLFIFGGEESETIISTEDGETTAQVYDGTEVLVSIDVEEGYVFQSLTITDGNGDPVETEELTANESYSFTMPTSNVTITATAIEYVAPTPGNYARVTSLSQLTNGSKVIIAARHNATANSYYAMPSVTLGKPEGVQFNSVVSDGNEMIPSSVSDEDYYWTVGITSDGYTFTNADEEVIGYTTGTNFASGGDNTEWTITSETSGGTTMVPDYTGFNIVNKNVNGRAFAFNGTVFGAYSTSNMTASGYNFFVDFFVESGETPGPEPCETIVLTEEAPTKDWTFEGLTTVTVPYTGEGLGNCWTWTRTTEIGDLPDTLPHLYYNSEFAHSGDYSLRLWFRGVYAMPMLDENVNINRVKMSFWSRHSYPFYTMMVGVMDNPTDPTTFVPVAYVDNGSSTDVKYFELDFSKYEGEGRYIAFKNVRRTNNELDGHFTDLHSVNYIDDITLTLMPETDCTIELADLPYTENFDAITSSTNTETGATPVCWKVVKEDAAMSLVTAPQVYYSSSYAYNGNYSLRMVNRGVYAMPALAEDIDVNKVRLSMHVRQPNALYQLQVGVWDEVNETFTPVALVNNSSTGIESFICDFSNYDGTGRRIAFRNVLGGGKTWSYSYNYIDNVVLSLAECAAITESYTESFEAVTTNTSTAATGAAPACWEVVEGSETLSYDGYPQVYYNGAFAHDGSYSLRMLDRCVYAMPEFAEGVNVGDLSMTMYVRQPYSFYQLEVGVWNGTEFTVVETVNNSDDAVTEVTVDFGGYEGTGRIAFRNSLNSGKTWSYSYNYIDEISFTVNASKMSADGGDNLDEADADRYLNNIAVYPNPTTGVLHIDAMDVQKVECYSQMGQLVGVYDNVNELNISELADGVYMLRITVPQGVTMRKVVKR